MHLPPHATPPSSPRPRCVTAPLLPCRTATPPRLKRARRAPRHPHRRRPASPARAPSPLLAPSIRHLARAARVPARPHPIPHAHAPPLRLERPAPLHHCAAPPRPHSRPPSYGSRGEPSSPLLHPHRAPRVLHFTPRQLLGPPISARSLPVPRNAAAHAIAAAEHPPHRGAPSPPFPDSNRPPS